MPFSSLLFIFAFLPVCLAAYYAVPPRFRNLAAVAASGAFYAWGAPRFVFVLIGGALLDHALARQLGRDDRGERARRGLLLLSLAMNLGLLGYFKYANFFIREFNACLGWAGIEPVRWTSVALPLGISFFTFQKISYVIDVYRRITRPASGFLACLTYVTLFPKLISGPIVRYRDVSDQLAGRRYALDRFMEGVWRFCVGLGKKVLLADALGEVVDSVFDLPIRDLAPSYAWVGAVGYSLQIYFDFAGYSDMAIGLGRMLGFDLPENFNCPYAATSFTDFWRRWHISLSGFMREYLYIPLGGNRVSPPRRYLNLWIVFLLSGLWHGAAWTFVLWGAYHGLFLTLDKLFWLKRVERLPKPLAVSLTFLLVTLGWVFFRSPDIGSALNYLARMFYVGAIAPDVLWADFLSHRAAAAMAVALLASFLPAWEGAAASFTRARRVMPGVGVGALRFGVAALLFLLSICSLANLSYTPFIYFRF